MRVYIQKQLLELLQTIWDGVKFAKSKNNKDNAESVLMDCYAAVNSVETAMKAELSSARFFVYSEAVTLLKAMLEFLYDAILSDQSVSEVSNDIKEQIKLIKKMLTDETEIKLEVLFLPYKASMWDCMETIYLSAMDDFSCDAYVVPIPYYDRNSDHSFGEMHYEGEEFPEYINVTHYLNYDISIRKPDIIYIHNPYDESNYVTSVDPAYYSAELKKHTGMLVYVPYFYMGHLFPENHLMLSAYKHADKIIVQSDAIRNQLIPYVNNIKPVALGSPKADKTIKCCQNKKIPAEWKDIIGDKKVLMYNVSLSGLLSYNEMAIKKMIYVLNSFIGRKDVVLLWRPHPLIESTLKSMRPEMWNMYEQIVEQFKANKVGIFDTTPDINESVAICDGYIGESSSSVVNLFGITGKPIFVTDMLIAQKPTEDEKTLLYTGKFIQDGENIWFVHFELNVLCCVNLNTGEMLKSISIPSKSILLYQYYDIKHVNDKIYLMPHNAKEICIYDMNTETFEFLPFKNAMQSANFYEMVEYKHYIFFIPAIYNAIVRLDTRNSELKYYSDAIVPLEKYKESEFDSMFILGAEVQGNKLILAAAKINKVIELDMDTGKSVIYTVGTKEIGFYNMTFDGTDYWLLPFQYGFEPYIIKWNSKTGKTTEYTEFPTGFQIKPNPRIPYAKQEHVQAFSSIVNCGEYVYVFPSTANMILKIDKNTSNIRELKLDLSFKMCDWYDVYYTQSGDYGLAQKLDETHIIVQSAPNADFLIIDVENETVEAIPCRISDEELQKLKRPIEFGESGYGLYCCNEMHTQRTLGDFLDYIASGNTNKNAVEQIEYYAQNILNLDGTSGEKIHQYITECVRSK